MTPLKHGLVDYSPLSGEIFLGDDTTISICGSGNLAMIPNGSNDGIHNLDVLHVPGLRYNLLSVYELCKLGLLLEYDVVAVKGGVVKEGKEGLGIGDVTY